MSSAVFLVSHKSRKADGNSGDDMADVMAAAQAQTVAQLGFIADPFFWMFIATLCAMAIVVVFLIVKYISPMMNSPAKHFVKARRENKPLVILDAGKYWKFIVGDKKVTEDDSGQTIKGEKGKDFVKTGNVGGMKYGEGVLMGVGEDFRSLVANISVIDLMEMIEKKGWDTEEVKARLERISEGLKKDLGYVDDAKLVNEKFKRQIGGINAEYDSKIEQITNSLKGISGEQDAGQGK